jgi:AcrR family transcriptional regulator
MSAIERPGRPALSREYIIETALALIDREGLEAFSIRKLAAEIGADPMALYYYFTGKAALFDGVVESIYAEIGGSEVLKGSSPRERLIEAGRRMRRAFLRHPRALPLIGTHPVSVRRLAPSLEALLSEAKEAGIALDRALDAVACIAVYVIGHALAQVGEPFGGTEAEVPSEAGIDGAAYPLLRAALSAFEDYDPDRQFDLGLESMVDGLIARFASARPTSSGSM